MAAATILFLIYVAALFYLGEEDRMSALWGATFILFNLISLVLLFV